MLLYISLCRDNGRKEKKCKNYFFQNYDMVKCRRNLNLEGMDIERLTGKKERF